MKHITFPKCKVLFVRGEALNMKCLHSKYMPIGFSCIACRQNAFRKYFWFRKKGCKNVSEQRRCQIWSKNHWKMAGNDRVPIDFPSVSIKRSYLLVYTQFLHSIDISICSCYSFHAIFNSGSRLSGAHCSMISR